MAIVHGVFAGIRGKVGNVIYQVNKGVQILKQMAYPENPQTQNQTTVRTVFGFIVAAFKNLATSWIRSLWNPFNVGNEQGWGRFIGANIDHMGTSFDGTDAILSLGSLEGVYDLAATYDTATGEVEVSWSGQVYTNGEDTDCANIAVYDSDQKLIVGIDLGSDTRVDEATSLNIEPGLTATNLEVYITMSDTEVLQEDPSTVSDSQHCTATAPA